MTARPRTPNRPWRVAGAFAAAALLGACATELESPPPEPASEPEFATTSTQALTFDPPSDPGISYGLVGEYYDTKNFGTLVMTRSDDEIDFDWAYDGPDPRMGGNTFSVRWNATLTPPTTGTYTFRTTSDDGSRLWVAGDRVVDNWGDHGSRSRTGDVDVVGGQAYPFRVDFYENGGYASVSVDVRVDGGSWQSLPTEWFANNPTGTGLHARWWNSADDMNAGDAPASSTTEPSAFVSDLDHGLPETVSNGANPPPGIAGDEYAVRLTGYLEPPATGSYQLGVDCDGPFYLWVDNSSNSGVAPFAIDEMGGVPTDDGVMTIDLEAGSRVGFHLDYVDQAGDGTCAVGWRKPLPGGDRSEWEYIPMGSLHPAALGDGDGLTGRYYDNIDFTNMVYKRTDRAVDFDWGNSSPAFTDGTIMGSDNYSIEWVGELEPLFSEDYTFHIRHSDGVRLWIDGVLVVNQWQDGSRESSGTVSLDAGQRVPIRLEYYEDGGDAHCEFSWESESQFLQIVPQTQLYAEQPDPSDGTGLEGHYFDNESFTDFFAMRIDPEINFNWGNASPMPNSGFGSDTFSVRWLGQVRPRYTETYTFETWSDDGVRLWIDGQLVLDNWTYHSPTDDHGSIDLIAGKRYDMRMEYFEGTGGAVARLLWESPSQQKEVIPEPRLYPPPVLGAGDGLLGEYYGAVDLDDRDLRLIRIDPWIAFDYDGEPPVDVLPPQNHGARWSGTFESIYDETYELTIRTNGGVRLWVEGVLLIDRFTDLGDQVQDYSAEWPMETGQLYDVQIEYSQADTHGVVEFLWESPSQVRQLVPMRQMYAAEPTARVEFGECESVIEITDFNPPDGEELPDGLVITDGLTLDGEVIRSPDLWVANTRDRTVTRFDTNEGTVVGTYPVGPDASRTAVDLNYDVWVANRAMGFWAETNGSGGIQTGGWNPDTFIQQMGTVTKLYHDCECPEDGSLCVDCVGPTIDLGMNSIPRGLAIDADNNVWVGTWNTQQLFKIDNETGAILGQFDAPVRPYGLAIDREGKIWISHINHGIGCFDTRTEEPCGVFTGSRGIVRGEGDNCISPYGIAVDTDMNVWFGNWNCDGLGRLDRESYEESVIANSDPLLPDAVDYDGVTARVDFFDHSHSYQSRGVAIDGQDRVWLASSGSNRLLQFDMESREWLGSYSASSTPIGVGISDTGDALAVAQNGPNGRGRVYAYNSDGQLEWYNDSGRKAYSYSDMTGFQLRNFTAPQGTWNYVFDCVDVSEPGCVFDYMTWDAIVPDETEVRVRLRVADRDEDTGEPIWHEWSPHFSATPAPLGRQGYAGQFVEVEVTLLSSPDGYAPTMHAVQLWRCPQIYAPEFFDVDERWIVDADARNYAISWQLVDDSWPETRWEFIDEDGNMRCLLESTTSITKGQLYSGPDDYPACVETHLLSNVPITRAVRTAFFSEDTGEWRRSPESEPITYYTLVNDPTVANHDMRILGHTYESITVNWCRPQNNWNAGLTGARVMRWTGTADSPDPGSLTMIADFPSTPTVSGRDRGYADDALTCGNFEDTGLEEGTEYFYSLQYQNGDAVVSEALVLSEVTWGAPCCDTLPEGCAGVCEFAVTGPTGCEYPDHYEADELACDELDNDCDGEVDEGLRNACNGECGPAPDEICDGIDNDCDGTIDVDPVVGPTYFHDGDGDAWGTVGTQSIRCEGGGGWVGNEGDCDDTNPDINPDAEEACNGYDDDCDGEIDESGGFADFYADADGDGYGDPDAVNVACTPPTGYVSDDSDCDDTRDTVHPGAEELCDGLDNDCDLEVDEGWADVGLDLVQVATTADRGVELCQNDYPGLACEGALAIEFMVTNASAYTVPGEVEVDFRMGDASGTRVSPPIALGRDIPALTTDTFIFCFGMEHDAVSDLWVGLHDIDESLPVCGDYEDTQSDVTFTGGDEVCDGQDNDCDGLVDDRACRVTETCVETFVGDWACVEMLTEEGDCEGEDCFLTCETDDECGDGAECRNGFCVDQRWLAGPEETAASAASAVGQTEGGIDDPGAREPGKSGCSAAAGGSGTSAGWAGMLFAMLMIRRRRCRGVGRT